MGFEINVSWCWTLPYTYTARIAVSENSIAAANLHANKFFKPCSSELAATATLMAVT